MAPLTLIEEQVENWSNVGWCQMDQGAPAIRSELVAVRATLGHVLARVESAAGDAPGRSKDLLKIACHKIDAMLSEVDPDGRLDAQQWSELLAGVTLIIRHLKGVLDDTPWET